MTSALSIASILLSLVAVAITTLFLARQTLFMRHANEIPVPVDLYQEWRTTEFQAARSYVRDSLSSSYEPSMGLARLPIEARNPTYKVAAFYSGLGALVAFGLVDERFAVSLLGDPAAADWTILEPHTFSQREINGSYGLKFRGVSEGYSSCRARC
jgi:hypothetical protein